MGRAEIASALAAAKAMHLEWNRLRKTNIVLDEDHPRDWADVRQEGKSGRFDVHLGHACGIL